MIVILKGDILHSEKVRFIDFLLSNGFMVRELEGYEENVLGVVGEGTLTMSDIESREEVKQLVPVDKPYKLASRDFHPLDTVVTTGTVKIGGSHIVTIAGPCSVESREQIREIAWKVREAGAVMLRGGAYKPRSSPYSFQGLGVNGLKFLREAGEETGLPVVSEVVSTSSVEIMKEYVNVFQIGTRNMQNFELLKAVGATGMPVVLKRGMAATIDEWLMAAEYLLSAGTDDVVLCERGIRTFGRATRNTLDISAIPVVRQLSHLPIVVDPSHATGIREKVLPMALASVAAGAHGLIIEVHNNPDKAFSDGAQSLWPVQFERLLRDVEALCPMVDKEMARIPERHHKAAISLHREKNEFSDQKPKVAFQGGRGAHSEKAVDNYFPAGEVETLSTSSFSDLFETVLSGKAVWGMVPIENSLAGSVLENYDLLSIHPEVKIVGEIKVRIRHNLIVLKGVGAREIRKVYSHPQALSQCSSYLEKRGWEAIPFIDTAVAAGMVAEKGDRSLAAIASNAVMKYYKDRLEILSDSIEANPRNYTRFAVIARQETVEPERANKASLTFLVKSHPGALAECLDVIRRNGINMTKIESRPILGHPWNYRFYVDVNLPENQKVFEYVRHELQKIAVNFRLLGIYRGC